MLEASTFDYFMDMLMVDYHIYVFPHSIIIIAQPIKFFSASSKKICNVFKLSLNYKKIPKLLIMCTHSHLHLKLLDHVHT
jgi:hypothetical protein